jgi:hypothetical protein
MAQPPNDRSEVVRLHYDQKKKKLKRLGPWGPWGWFGHPQKPKLLIFYFILFFFSAMGWPNHPPWATGWVRPPPMAKTLEFFFIFFIFFIFFSAMEWGHPRPVKRVAPLAKIGLAGHPCGGQGVAQSCLFFFLSFFLFFFIFIFFKF